VNLGFCFWKNQLVKLIRIQLHLHDSPWYVRIPYAIFGQDMLEVYLFIYHTTNNKNTSCCNISVLSDKRYENTIGNCCHCFHVVNWHSCFTPEWYHWLFCLISMCKLLSPSSPLSFKFFTSQISSWCPTNSVRTLTVLGCWFVGSLRMWTNLNKLLLIIYSLWWSVNLNQHSTVKAAGMCISLHQCRTQYSTEQFW